MGVIGKKWSLLILRDIELRNVTRFTDLSLSVRGITRRMLSTRLSELSRERLIEKSEIQTWQLTPKGKDMMTVLGQLAMFRIKWDRERIFGAEPTGPVKVEN